MKEDASPNTALQRTRSAPLRSPLSFETFGDPRKRQDGVGPCRVFALAVGVVLISLHSLSAERPAPDGCHWQEISEVKLTIAVPDGWKFRKLPGAKDLLVFEVTPAGPHAPQDSRSRYELRIRRRTPIVTVVQAGKDFVEGFLKNAVEATPLEEQLQGVVSMFAGVAHLGPTLFGVAQRTVAACSLANSRTGTLYTVQIEIPAAELDSIMPLANAIFRVISVDDEI